MFSSPFWWLLQRNEQMQNMFLLSTVGEGRQSYMHPVTASSIQRMPVRFLQSLSFPLELHEASREKSNRSERCCSHQQLRPMGKVSRRET